MTNRTSLLFMLIVFTFGIGCAAAKMFCPKIDNISQMDFCSSVVFQSKIGKIKTAGFLR